MDPGSLLRDWDWGSIPEWLGAAGTIAAVAFALASSRSTKQQLITERAEAAADRERFREKHEREMFVERRQLASLVSLKVDRGSIISGVDKDRMTCSIRNGGSQTIRMVQLLSYIRSDEPGGERKMVEWWTIIEGEVSKEVRIDHEFDEKISVEMQFTDAYDVPWRLNQYGKLREVNNPPAAIESEPSISPTRDTLRARLGRILRKRPTRSGSQA